MTKTAKPAFARDYDWTIEKSVKGASSQTVPQGTPASFAYDVVVTPSAAKDTAFVVSGVISVQNPNPTTISGVQLTDSLPGGQCTIDKPAGPLSIQKGTSTFDYSCVLPGATPTTTGTNTATASWDKAAYHGTSGSASGTAGVDFAQATVVVTDATATVTDTQVQLGDVPGGAVVKASDGPRTFTYTKAFDGVPGTCTTYDNTAKVVATDSKESDSDDATVEVCVQQPLRAGAHGQGRPRRRPRLVDHQGRRRHPAHGRRQRQRDLHLHGDGPGRREDRVRMAAAGRGGDHQPQPVRRG